MNKPIIISYYTPNYNRERDRFIKSIREHAPDFDFRIDKIQSMGGWIDNVYYRPEFILAMMEEYHRDVVWVDIDAEILRYPELFIDFKYTFGAYIHRWDQYRPEVPGGYDEVMGGTMYFKHCAAGKDFIKKWIKANKNIKEPRSQLVLTRLIHTMPLASSKLTTPLFSMINLPSIYTYIPGLMPNVKDPVIKHDNASVRYRSLPAESFNKENYERLI